MLIFYLPCAIILSISRSKRKCHMTFSKEMIDAIKVQFIKPIFEDDFPAKGMKAWLVDIVERPTYGDYNSGEMVYELYFDFSEFEKENFKYFKEQYYGNSITEKAGLYKDYYTAIETGMYSPKYSVLFSVTNTHDDLSTLEDFLRIIN